jgi:hypothetical protein
MAVHLYRNSPLIPLTRGILQEALVEMINLHVTIDGSRTHPRKTETKQ